MELSYADIMSDLQDEIVDKGVVYTAKDNTKVTLRPLRLLGDAELKTAQTLLKSLNDEKDEDDSSIDKQSEVITTVLVCAADKKDALKKDLKDFPISVKTQIFNAWMEADRDQGEDSTSES